MIKIAEFDKLSSDLRERVLDEAYQLGRDMVKEAAEAVELNDHLEKIAENVLNQMSDEEFDANFSKYAAYGTGWGEGYIEGLEQGVKLAITKIAEEYGNVELAAKLAEDTIDIEKEVPPEVKEEIANGAYDELTNDEKAPMTEEEKEKAAQMALALAEQAAKAGENGNPPVE